jgi:hypothetical protein
MSAIVVSGRRRVRSLPDVLTLVPNDLSGRKKHDILGDVGGMVGDALEVFGH